MSIHASWFSFHVYARVYVPELSYANADAKKGSRILGPRQGFAAFASSHPHLQTVLGNRDGIIDMAEDMLSSFVFRPWQTIDARPVL